jgi:enoyl-CoA hydratase/carnithine racemase
LIRETIGSALDASEPIKALAVAMQTWPADKWLDRAKSSFLAGSPVTAEVIIEQLKRARHQSMAEMFRMELDIASACSRFGEFTEGVRALLIDKDGQPAWQYPLGEVPRSHIEAHFEPVASPHPLQDLD